MSKKAKDEAMEMIAGLGSIFGILLGTSFMFLGILEQKSILLIVSIFLILLGVVSFIIFSTLK